MLNKISDLLSAILSLLEQKHLLAKDYQQHLLYERLQSGISEDTDRIKEIALACGYNEEIADAKQSLAKAKAILEQTDDLFVLMQKIIKEINIVIEILNKTENEQIEGTFDQFQCKEGIINILGDIAEKRIRDIYLLRFLK